MVFTLVSSKHFRVENYVAEVGVALSSFSDYLAHFGLGPEDLAGSVPKDIALEVGRLSAVERFELGDPLVKDSNSDAARDLGVGVGG